MLQHKGYTGMVEFDPIINRLAGHVVDLRDDLYFEGRSVDNQIQVNSSRAALF